MRTCTSLVPIPGCCPVNWQPILLGSMAFLSSTSRFFKVENRAAAPETILNYLKACEEAAIQREFGPLLEVRGNYLKMVL